MVPLSSDSDVEVTVLEEGWRRSMALRHALRYHRGGVLWGDDPKSPRSIVLIREGDGQWEAFGAGRPEPAVGWLAHRPGAVALLAPASWEGALRDAVGPLERGAIETYLDHATTDRVGPGLAVAVRRLSLADAVPFGESAPAWALRGWGSFAAMIEHAIAFGAPGDRGFAALAWVFDQADGFSAIGVHTAPRYRRLGLGRAVASALLDQLVERGQVPLWSTPPENEASKALARSLGFSGRATEPLLRWTEP